MKKDALQYRNDASPDQGMYQEQKEFLLNISGEMVLLNVTTPIFHLWLYSLPLSVNEHGAYRRCVLYVYELYQD